MGQIVVNLDVEMAKRKMSLSELAERVGLTLANLSILIQGTGDPDRGNSVRKGPEMPAAPSPRHPLTPPPTASLCGEGRVGDEITKESSAPRRAVQAQLRDSV